MKIFLSLLCLSRAVSVILAVTQRHCERAAVSSCVRARTPLLPADQPDERSRAHLAVRPAPALALLPVSVTDVSPAAVSWQDGWLWGWDLLRPPSSACGRLLPAGSPRDLASAHAGPASSSSEEDPPPTSRSLALAPPFREGRVCTCGPTARGWGRSVPNSVECERFRAVSEHE